MSPAATIPIHSSASQHNKECKKKHHPRKRSAANTSHGQKTGTAAHVPIIPSNANKMTTLTMFQSSQALPTLEKLESTREALKVYMNLHANATEDEALKAVGTYTSSSAQIEIAIMHDVGKCKSSEKLCGNTGCHTILGTWPRYVMLNASQKFRELMTDVKGHPICSHLFLSADSISGDAVKHVMRFLTYYENGWTKGANIWLGGKDDFSAVIQLWQVAQLFNLRGNLARQERLRYKLYEHISDKNILTKEDVVLVWTSLNELDETATNRALHTFAYALDEDGDEAWEAGMKFFAPHEELRARMDEIGEKIMRKHAREAYRERRKRYVEMRQQQLDRFNKKFEAARNGEVALSEQEVENMFGL